MANVLVNLLCGLWSCIKGSLRMILFLGCSLLVLIQLLFLLQLTSTYETQNSFVRTALLGQKIGFQDYLYACSLLFIALLGAYGSFYKHKRSIKLFSILVIITSIILTIGFCSGIANEELQKEHVKFIDRMRNYSTQYDWTEGKNHGTGAGEQATKAWDMLQILACCGIKGPEDWDKMRPSEISSSEYPTSCCLPTEERRLCHKIEIYKTGCSVRIDTIETLSVMVTVLYVAFLYLLSIIAFVLLLPEASDSVSTSSRRGVLPQEYQRFEGSVFVRQPATAPQNTQPIQKNSNPPMYPKIQDVEKKGASSPPPSYH